jgi:hypothetical protein
MAYNRGVLPVYTDFMAEVCEKNCLISKTKSVYTR